jgi:hypothetical protein
MEKVFWYFETRSDWVCIFLGWHDKNAAQQQLQDKWWVDETKDLFIEAMKRRPMGSGDDSTWDWL